MKKFFALFVIIMLAACSVSVAQDEQSLTTSDDTFVTTESTPKLERIPFKEPAPTMWYVPHEMVVKIAAEATDADRLAITRENDITVTGNAELDELNRKYKVTRFVQEFPRKITRTADAPPDHLSRYYLMTFGKEFELKEVLAAYKACGEVENTEAIGVHPIYERIPNDVFFASYQWNLKDAQDNDIDATDAWDLETGDDTIILGNLDSGLQYNSRDLGGSAPWTDGNVWINWTEYDGSPGVDDDGNGKIDDWVGWDFVDNVYGAWPGEDADEQDNEPTDFNGHGTHIAGIMGAITNNGYGIAGIDGGWGTPANGVKIMACRIGWSAPHPVYGYEVGYVRMDFAAQAMYYATDMGATAVNCSWGSSNSGGLGAAVTYAINNGVIVAHAAGNDGSQSADYLGSRTDVINVCATNSSDIKASWSNYGTWVDIAAPGVDIASTYSDHYTPDVFVLMSGTSQASPHVCAAAGMLKSYVPTLSTGEITALILDHTDYIDDLNPAYAGRMGSGRLNVFRSLDAAMAPSVTVIQPNGGEVLYIGQEYDVLWDASDNVGIDSTMIDYSIDSGDNWIWLGSIPGNPGTWTWTVTGPPSSTCRMRVTCYDGEGVAGSDMSNDDFCPPYKVAGEIGIAIAQAGSVPAQFAMYQNYPNPFNAQTNFKYALREDCHVRLEVYNVLGRRVDVLVDEFQSAGYQAVHWNAGDLASGMYLYRLQAGDFVETRKLVLMK